MKLEIYLKAILNQKTGKTITCQFYDIKAKETDVGHYRINTVDGNEILPPPRVT